MPDSRPGASPFITDLEAEAYAKEAVIRLAAELAAVVAPIWRWGDGYGGAVYQVLDEAFAAAGLPAPPRNTSGRKKAVIPTALRWEVWNRDDFTCVDCGSREDLTVDHVHPESKGGPTTLANLATRCRSCNSRKGVR